MRRSPGGPVLHGWPQRYALRGRYLSLQEDARALAFRFELHDGGRERELLDRVKAGDVAGCSIRFKPDDSQVRYVGPRSQVTEYGAAQLIEISACAPGGRPLWYDTYLGIEA